MADWRVSLLRSIGAPATPTNLQFLDSWQRREGGHTNNNARFNFLNTTRGSEFPSINSVGVRAFPNLETGIQKTAETLLNGRYNNIVAGLRSGDVLSAPIAGDLSTWVSGSPTRGLQYASRVLGGKVPASRSAPSKGIEKIDLRHKDLSQKVSQGVVPQDTSRQSLTQYIIATNNALISGSPLPSIAPYLRQSQLTQDTKSPEVKIDLKAKTPKRQLQSAANATGTLQLAVGGEKFSNLGGPAEHHRRPLGNWQSDNAWDLGVPLGTPVYAVSDGIVGNEIGIQSTRPRDGSRLTLHGGKNKYWYGHLSRIEVTPGQRIRRGQLLGYSGASANGVAHLHIGFQNLGGK